MKNTRWIWPMVLVLLVFGCTSSSTWQPSVNLKISTAGTLSTGQPLSGVAITLILPSRVTPALDSSGQVDINRLVTASGVAAAGGLAATAVYIEATGTQPARLSLIAASKAKDGFGVGEFMILTLNRDVFASFGAGDFTVAEFAAADLNGKAVSGLQANIVVI